MFELRLSRLLLLLGAAVGIGSVVIWGLEMRINFPDWMIRVAMIKLAFIASLGLLAGGALLGRHAKTRSLPANGSPALAEPMTESVAEGREGVSRVEIERGEEMR
jgi:hypothetical protein